MAENLAAFGPDADAIASYAVARHAAGDIEAAVRAYRRLVDLVPGFAAAHSSLAQALHDLGRWGEAVESYRQAVAIRADAETYVNLGAALIDLGRNAEAREACERAIALRPDLAEAHANLAASLDLTGEQDAAVVAFGRALALNPALIPAARGLARILLDTGRPGEAAAICRATLAIVPAQPAIELLLARAEAAGGDLEAALERLVAWLDAGRDRPLDKTAPAHFQFTRSFFEPGALTPELRGALRDLLDTRIAAGDRRPPLLFLSATDRYLCGALAAAQALYAEAAADRHFGIGGLVRFDAAFFEALEGQPMAPLPEARLAEVSESDGPAVFVAADSRYFLRYVVPLLHSLDAHGRMLTVYLHLYDADPGILDAIPGFATRLPNLDLRVGHEVADMPRDPESRLAWFIALRFVRLAQLLEKSRAPILAIDADMLALADPAPIFAIPGDADIAWMDYGSVEPYNQIIAYALLVRPTAAARRFMTLVARIIARHLADGAAHWYLDQLALYLAMHHLQSIGSELQTFDFMKSREGNGVFFSCLAQGSSGKIDAILSNLDKPDWLRFP
jgi:tetratricopeptide (TPR) repeat protein